MERSQSKPGPVTESKHPDGKIAAFSYQTVSSYRGTQIDLGKIHRCEKSFSKGRFSIIKYNATFNEKRSII